MTFLHLEFYRLLWTRIDFALYGLRYNWEAGAYLWAPLDPFEPYVRPGSYPARKANDHE